MSDVLGNVSLSGRGLDSNGYMFFPIPDLMHLSSQLLGFSHGALQEEEGEWKEIALLFEKATYSFQASVFSSVKEEARLD